ncbi:MAG: hypothetical protein K6B46_00630 [Opitutales bacterium]|nr:hypothetical protein [Opitutales bacterium]
MLLLIKSLGFLLSLLPRPVIRGLCVSIAHLLLLTMPRRRRVILNNLSHFDENLDEGELKALALESTARTIETGIFALVSPFFSQKKIRRLYKFDTTLIDQVIKQNRCAVVGVPHFSQMEALTALKLFSETVRDEIKIGVFYRPFGSKSIERWVKSSRERFGMRLLSRKEGLVQAKTFLNSGNVVAVLFDQSPGGWRGALSLFDGRIATVSELAGALAADKNALLCALYCERTGVFSGTIHFEVLNSPDPNDKLTNTLVLNDWLVDKMRHSRNLCADWLWLHDRFKGTNTFLRPHKKNLLPQTLDYYHLKSLPQNFRLWIRLPNWLGDIVMALPLIQTFRRERPDAKITLLARKHFLPMLEQLNVGDERIALPPKGKGYYRFCRSLSRFHPDALFLFTNSLRSDIEARLIGARTSFGMRRDGYPRPLLEKAWRVPATIDLTRTHQTRVWERWFQSLHLNAPLDLSPLPLKDVEKQFRIGLICGTENSPEKRWPVQRWREFIAQATQAYPDLEIYLFGTAKDGAITAQVAREQSSNVVDRAGKTDLPAYMRELSTCRAIVCNDTGGMHLANMLGVPVIAIFGPTNPVRTGPVFDAPKFILQPENCPPTGGMDIALVPAERALAALKTLL